MEIIFDVGAFDAADYMERCKNNAECHVYAFEPQPIMIEKIRQAATGLPNFHLFEGAVSNFTGKAKFYLSGGGAGGLSSLRNYVQSEQWGKKKFDVHIPVNVITLKDFIEQNKIERIDYLHVDAQGADLDVLNGLGDYHAIVKAGDMEVQIYPLYEGAHTLEDAKRWLDSHGWHWSCRFIEGVEREANIFFTNPAWQTLVQSNETVE